MEDQLNMAIEQCTKIVQEGEAEGITLRVMGGIAVRIHCPRYGDLLSRAKRAVNDIDFVGYKKEKRDVIRFFRDKLGHRFDTQLMIMMDRCIFEDESRDLHEDVFFDEIRMNHVIDLRKRLRIDSLTISLADLLLQKMQIVKISERDIQDSIVLLAEHDVGDGDDEMINSHYIAKILSRDWGFYHTVTMNLGKVLTYLPELGIITEEIKSDVESKVRQLLEAIEGQPKSVKWRTRQKIGTKISWYEEVEEVTESRLYTKDLA